MHSASCSWMLQGLLVKKDTHRPMVPRQGYTWEHRTFLGAVRVLNFTPVLERTVHHAVGAYSRPMPMRLGPPGERCETLSSSNPCAFRGTSLVKRTPLGPYRRPMLRVLGGS